MTTWIDASAGVYSDTGSVRIWRNQSGRVNARDLLQLNSIYAPQITVQTEFKLTIRASDWAAIREELKKRYGK